VWVASAVQGTLAGAADDPLLYLERKAYLSAVQDAIASLV
jgi:hypothetical protein